MKPNYTTRRVPDQVDGCHTTGTEFFLDGVAVGQGGCEAVDLASHCPKKLRVPRADSEFLIVIRWVVISGYSNPGI